MMADVDGVVGAAVAQTGLEDFGDDSFREGLELLLASLRDEARLNARGEGFIHARIVNALAQRLQVEDWYRRHPEIDDVELLPPLIGLGLPRTGFDGVVGAARAGPGDPIPAPLGIVATLPAAVDRDGPGSADSPGRAQQGRLAERMCRPALLLRWSVWS